MKKIEIFISALLLLTSLGGCAVQPAVSGDGIVQNPTGNISDNLINGGSDNNPTTQPNIADGDVFYEAVPIIQEQNILKQGTTAVLQERGVSYSIQGVECTKEFGNRAFKNLSDFSQDGTDEKGNLLGNERYLFLTIAFTNISSDTIEISRNNGGPCVIKSNGEGFNFGNAVYVDEAWTGGAANEVFHWVLKPGETITSEVGWLIPEWEDVRGWIDLRGESLYYEAKMYDGLDEPENLFIDLGIKVGE